MSLAFSFIAAPTMRIVQVSVSDSSSAFESGSVTSSLLP